MEASSLPSLTGSYSTESHQGVQGTKKGIEGAIVTSTAEKSYTETGKEIGLGTRTTRLQLADLNHPQFYIDVIPKGEKGQVSGLLNTLKSKIHHVDLKVNGQTVLVNVNSLAQRLHLSEKDILQASNEGRLEEFLESKKEHIKSLPARVIVAQQFGKIPEPKMQEVLNHYAEIIDKHDVNANGELVARSAGPKDPHSGISKSELVKVLYIALSKPLPNGGALIPTGGKINREVKTGMGRVSQERSQYIMAERSPDGKLSLSVLYGKQLGEGTAGTVEKVLNLSTGQFEALKTINAEKMLKRGITYEQMASMRDNLIFEAKQVHELNPTGRAPGIQKPPDFIYTISGKLNPDNTESSPEVTGFLTPLYNRGDLSDAWASEDRTVKQNINACHQMLSGLVYAKSQGCPHGDIKPQNVFVNKNPDGTEDVHIADWGGTQFCRNNEEFQQKMKNPIGSKSPGYLTAEDAGKMSNAKNMEDYNKAAFSRDVYALGVTIYEMFIKNQSGIPNEDMFKGEQWQHNIGLLKAKGVGNDMIQLLESMLAPSDRRIDAEHALAQLEVIMNKK